MLIVRLPFPDKKLMTNKSEGRHWTATYNLKRAQKEAAFFLTKEALSKTGPQEFKEFIPLSLLFLMPDKRHRDHDGLSKASKHAIDGIAAALGVDDYRFKPVLYDWVLGPKEGGLIAAVGVTIQSGVNIPV